MEWLNLLYLSSYWHQHKTEGGRTLQGFEKNTYVALRSEFTLQLNINSFTYEGDSLARC
jgi:hypothetical protein